MTKEVEELRKLIKELVKIEIKSRKEVEEITENIKDERRKSVRIDTVIKNQHEINHREKLLKNGFCQDMRIPKRIKNGEISVPA